MGECGSNSRVSYRADQNRLPHTHSRALSPETSSFSVADAHPGRCIMVLLGVVPVRLGESVFQPVCFKKFEGNTFFYGMTRDEI